MFGGKSCFPAHKGTQSSMIPTTTWPDAFTLKHQGNWRPCINTTHSPHCSTDNRRCKPAGLVPQCWQQYHCTAIPEVQAGNQVPELPWPTSLVPPSLQQPLWLLVNRANKQASGLPLPQAWFPCAGTALPEAQLVIRPWNSVASSLGSPMPGGLLYYSPRAHAQKAGPRIPAAWRLGSPGHAAAVMPAPVIRPQGSWCLQACPPSPHSSCHSS
jgi:hypothetical protein